MNESTIRSAVGRADRSGSYAEAIHILLGAGVRLYHVEVASHTVVYSSDVASYEDRGVSRGELQRPSQALSSTAIEAAMHAIDHGETDYAGFLNRLSEAGVVEYDVNLIWRQITFRGADDHTYLRAIDALEKELVRA